MAGVDVTYGVRSLWQSVTFVVVAAKAKLEATTGDDNISQIFSKF